MEEIDTRIEMIDTKIDTKFEAIDTKIDNMFEAIDTKIDTMLEAIDTKITAIDTKIDTKLEAILSVLQKKNEHAEGDTQVHIENKLISGSQHSIENKKEKTMPRTATFQQGRKRIPSRRVRVQQPLWVRVRQANCQAMSHNNKVQAALH
jgi:hypothetical protein